MRREMILKVIQNYPGISFNEIVRKTELSNGVVTHHILQLMNNKELIKYGERRGKYFDATVSKENREIIVILRNDTNLGILKFLLKMNDPQKANMICRAVNRSSSTISNSLKELQKKSLVEREILNKSLKLKSDLGYQISNKDFLRNILQRYDI